MWNLSEDDRDLDFQEIQAVPLVEVDESSLPVRKRAIVKWLLIFLCMWSSYCTVSDNALDILLAFLRTMFEALGTIFPVLASFGLLIPKSLHLLRKQLGMDKDRFVKYVVFKNCDTLYYFYNCYTIRNHRKVIRNCSFVPQPNSSKRNFVGKNEHLLLEILRNDLSSIWPFVKVMLVVS